MIYSDKFFWPFFLHFFYFLQKIRKHLNSWIYIRRELCGMFRKIHNIIREGKMLHPKKNDISKRGRGYESMKAEKIWLTPESNQWVPTIPNYHSNICTLSWQSVTWFIKIYKSVGSLVFEN